MYINGLRTERIFCKIHVTLSVRRQLDVDKLKFIVLWVVISNIDGAALLISKFFKYTDSMIFIK